MSEVLRVVGLVKEFSGVRALDGVDLAVRPGTVHALLGGNGSGKSTLIRALAGVAPAEAGSFAMNGTTIAAPEMTPRISRQSGFRFVHQQRAVFPDLTVAENLAIGHGWELGATRRIRWGRQRSRAAELLDRFSVRASPDQLLGSCSVATQTMVCVARAMQDLEGSGLLVLDEPTSSFPPAQVDVLLEFVRKFARSGHAAIYVSHRLDEVVAVADHATILRDGRVDAEIVKDELSHDRLSRAIIGPAVTSVGIGAGSRRIADGPPLLEVRGLTGSLVSRADLDLKPGEVVGLAGLLGSGRSTLLELLFGSIARSGGTVRLGGADVPGADTRAAMRAGIAYIPEDRASDAAFTDLTVLENISMATGGEHFRGGRLRHRSERRAARDLMTAFSIKAPSVAAPMSTLSGGNQQKVILARWLRREPKVILLDEPTQGVDVGARAEIWQLIRQAVDAGASALVATSDLDEMATFCDRALVLRSGRLVGAVSAGDMTEHQLQLRAFGLKEEAS